MKILDYEAGQIIFNENDTGETAYVIEHGRVEVTRKLGGKSVHLAYLGPGEPFGEMGMIDEKPRSATVTAVEHTMVRELHRDDFVSNLQKHPDVAISLLKVLFERLREADTKIMELHKSHPELMASRTPGADVVVSLEGLTPQAQGILPRVPFEIRSFPFRIGRQSPDPLLHNDLSIPDVQPMQISRHHATIIKEKDRIGVSDRGSRLGSLVDGRQLGGNGEQASMLFFDGDEGTLILGNRASPFKFKVIIQHPRSR